MMWASRTNAPGQEVPDRAQIPMLNVVSRCRVEAPYPVGFCQSRAFGMLGSNEMFDPRSSISSSVVVFFEPSGLVSSTTRLPVFRVYELDSQLKRGAAISRARAFVFARFFKGCLRGARTDTVWRSYVEGDPGLSRPPQPVCRARGAHCRPFRFSPILRAATDGAAT